MTKHEIVDVMREIAFFLSLSGDNPYKAQAYERAETALLTSPLSLPELIATNSLTEISGIGPATTRVITELVATGHSPVLQQARGSYPPSLMTLNEIPRPPANKSSSCMNRPASPHSRNLGLPAAKADS